MSGHFVQTSLVNCSCLFLFEELVSTSVQSDGHTALTITLSNASCYCVSLFHTVQVAIQGFYYCITSVSIHLVRAGDHATNSNGINIDVLIGISLSLDNQLGIERILSNQSISFSRINRQ